MIILLQIGRKLCNLWLLGPDERSFSIADLVPVWQALHIYSKFSVLAKPPISHSSTWLAQRCAFGLCAATSLSPGWPCLGLACPI
jgi:hypothetical protein